MSNRYRPTSAQKRAIIAAIVRYENEHRDELNALRASVERFEAEFDEGEGRQPKRAGLG
jgi:hypothetical protein